ncbi:MAG TPA: histidinol dehydrogenase [Vicinamibacterales bacterium]|nr:histidinol dehydrogenase [Vicinamibacterales bacterium]
MRIVRTTNRRALERLFARDRARDREVALKAARIVADVRRRGDRALTRWMRELDDVKPPFDVTRRAMDEGWRRTSPEVRRAIRKAARAVRTVAERQLPRSFAVDTADGVRIEQRVRPFGRVGCYVPGGRHPLPSTVLMTAVPAAVAGVGDIVVACPRPAPEVLCAAVEAGVSRVLRIGGAQAIAALAYGTTSIARVDKIAGPGNVWVTAAKALVASDCAIDLPAGPSEIVVCANRGRADWIAIDLVAQAEHDPQARAVFVTTSSRLAAGVSSAIGAMRLAAGPARASLAKHGAIVIARTRGEAVEIVNRLAPEHLVCDAPFDPDQFTTAGTIFRGRWSAQAAGDYATGSNHVLPTGGAARTRGGLSTSDFVRTFTVQTIGERGLRAIGPAAIALAKAEGLEAHAESIAIRLRPEF